MELREVNLLAVILRILVALTLGGCIGLERGLKNRPAGLRTYILVCVGSCLIMLTNQYIYQIFQTGDPVRMGAQVVSGIGFLGAGTIVVTQRSQIKGLTTAAGLWAAAAVGLAIGIGFYEAAIFGSIVIFAVLTILQRFDTMVHRNAKYLEIYTELSPGITLGDFMKQVRDFGVEFDGIQVDADNYLADGTRSYVAALKSGKRFNHAELLTSVQSIPGVIRVEAL